MEFNINKPKSLKNRPLFNQPYSVGWIVCLSAALFFFYQFLQMSSFNTIGADLAADFGLNAMQLGKLSSLYLCGLALSFIPAGFLLDHFSSRKLILSALLIAIANTLLFSQAHTFWLIETGRFLLGVTHSIAFLGCCRLTSRWLPSCMAFAMGCVITIGLLGGIVAQAPLILLSNHLGWRNAFLILASFGLLIWLVLWLFLRDYPQDHSSIKNNYEFLTLIKNLGAILQNSQNWCLALYTCLLNLPIIILGEVWGIAYLSHQNNLSPLQAASVISMIYIGTIVGSPLVGLFSDKIGKRKLPMVVGAITSLLLILLAILCQKLSLYELTVLFFLIGFFTSTQLLSYPLITSRNPPALATGALGFASIIVMGGGGIFQPLFGWLIDKPVENSVLGVHITHYELAFSLLPMASLSCIILACLIRENR